MESAFFWVSKIAWYLVSPDTVMVLAVVASWILLARGAVKWARRLLGLIAGGMLLLTVLPVGEWVLHPLEMRFPTNPPLPQRVDGIIVLGGAEDPVGSTAWDQVEVNDAAERFLASAELSRRFPQAKLVLTSGSGNPLDQKSKPADVGRRFFREQGLDSARIIFEDQSRNTAENVARSKALARPAPGEVWLLVTSAFHIPRSVGIFCRAGWPVIPYPVDHRTQPSQGMHIGPGLSGNINNLTVGIKEWLGLAAYYATGRTSTLFPAGCAP